MKKNSITALVVLLLAAIAVLVFISSREKRVRNADSPSAPTAPVATATPSSVQSSSTAQAPPPKAAPPPDPKATLAAIQSATEIKSAASTTLPATTTAVPAAQQSLENVHFALRDYRNALGENPVGTNAEITRMLLGDNLKQVKIPVPDGSSVNGNGELCDDMGTPYFFHQLSATKMEIRSAGPDRQMWTADDQLQ